MNQKNNADLPKISVVIPSYNSERYIEETLNSILDQNYPHLEIIIQDAVSTDQTISIVKRFIKKHSKVISLESAPDKGQYDAVNKGLKKATGHILTFLNTDDLYTKNSLLKVGKIFQQNPDLLWVTGYCPIIDEHSNEFSSFIGTYKNFLMKLNWMPLLLSVNYISQPATFFSNEAYQKYGPFIGANKYILEYDFWLKLARVKMPKIINSNLAKFRLVTGTLSSTSFNNILKDDYEIVKKYTNNPLILILHQFNNLGRLLLVNLLNRGKAQI